MSNQNQNQKQDLSCIVCRYCKKTGHYKQACPKLMDKPPRDMNSRQTDHTRLLHRNGNSNMNNNSNRNDNSTGNDNSYSNRNHRPRAPPPVIIKEPEVDDFPVLGSGSKSTLVQWGGAKSFVDIAKTKPVKDETIDPDSDKVILEIL